jgi:hypothetical protein
MVPSSGAKSKISINMTKAMKTTIAATRPLSSKVVDSVRKAWQVGKPNPNDTPSNALESKENSNPRKTVSETIVKNPKANQNHKNFLRSTLSLIKLPINPEKTAKP